MNSISGVDGQVDGHLAALDAAVDALLADDLSTLPDDAVTAALTRLESTMRKAATAGTRLIVETVERSIPAANGCKSINTFLIQTLRLSVHDAATRVAAARNTGTWHTLTGDELAPAHAATAAAARDGAIGADHVETIRQVMRRIPRAVDAAQREVAEQILAELARHETPKAFADAGAHLLAHLNPDGSLTDEHDRKRLRRFTMGKQGPDLLTPISGLIDPKTRALLEPLLAKYARPGMNNPDDPDSPTGSAPDTGTGTGTDRDALARAAARDTRTAGQRGHDALAAMLHLLNGSRAVGRHRGLPVTAIITMTLQQLETATGLATTASGGILPIKDALQMLEHAHPVLCLFDHHGRPLHLGRTKRLATADQRLALIAASRGCTRPGCDTPATMTAVHHVHGWNKGAPTDIDELDLACDACHALIHDGPGGWQTVTGPASGTHPGRTHWIAPPHIDPHQRPRVNDRHHLGELLTHALKRAQTRRRGDSAGRASRPAARGDGSGADADDDVP